MQAAAGEHLGLKQQGRKRQFAQVCICWAGKACGHQCWLPLWCVGESPNTFAWPGCCPPHPSHQPRTSGLRLPSPPLPLATLLATSCSLRRRRGSKLPACELQALLKLASEVVDTASLKTHERQQFMHCSLEVSQGWNMSFHRGKRLYKSLGSKEMAARHLPCEITISQCSKCQNILQGKAVVETM